jgi:hypothetical protein
MSPLSKAVLIVALLFFVVQNQAAQGRSARLLAANETVKNESAKQPVAKPAANSQKQFPDPPKFKDDEYAIFIGDSYQVFKTKKYESLELNDGCFKGTKPKCQAYEFAQIKPKDLSVKVPGLNNKSAIHCEAVGGRNLLALDNKNNQYNFCRFADGSMVNSWSMNYKHFPQNVIK